MEYEGFASQAHTSNTVEVITRVNGWRNKVKMKREEFAHETMRQSAAKYGFGGAMWFGSSPDMP